MQELIKKYENIISYYLNKHEVVEISEILNVHDRTECYIFKFVIADLKKLNN